MGTMNRARKLASAFALLAVLLALAMPAQAQTAPGALPSPNALPSFDVVSIKPGKPGCVSVGIGGFTPGEFQALCISLRGIIAYAYGYYDFTAADQRVLGGPAWINSRNFDIEAKVTAADLDVYRKLDPSQIGQMLQQMLASRFNLKAHHETRIFPVYALVVAKGGPKISPVKPGDPSGAPKGLEHLPSGILRRGHGKLIAWNSPLSRLEPFLRSELGRPVVDETGLTGNYTFTLEWTPELLSVSSTNGGGTEDSAPSIFTALQEQLGLKLVAKKAPLAVLVIDHVEQPSPN